LNITPQDSTMARLWFSNSNEPIPLPIPSGIDVYRIDSHSEALLKSFNGSYFITWFNDYVVKNNGVPFISIVSSRTQNIIEHEPTYQDFHTIVEQDMDTFQ
jgi:hypothetical protein